MLVGYKIRYAAKLGEGGLIDKATLHQMEHVSGIMLRIKRYNNEKENDNKEKGK